MNEKVLEVSLENSLADRLADIAMTEMGEDEIKNITKQCLDKLDVWRNDKSTWHHKVTPVEEKILKQFYYKVGEVVDKLLNEDDEFITKVDDEARRIIRMARESAEKYMVEAIANRMCLHYSDFQGDKQRCDMTTIVNNVMMSHLEHSHNVPY